MRWTITIKDQTHGAGTEIARYACRVTRATGVVRLSVENLGPGVVREGRFLMPPPVARLVGNALLMASGASESMNIEFALDEPKGKAPRSSPGALPPS